MSKKQEMELTRIGTKKFVSSFENRFLKLNLYPVGFYQQTCQASTCKPKCGGSFFAPMGS